MFFSLRWSSTLQGLSFAAVKAEINSILSGRKECIEKNFINSRMKFIGARRYDLLVYLLSNHLRYLMENNLINENRKLNELEVVEFLYSLDYKRIGTYLKGEFNSDLAKTLMFDIARLGDYNLLEKYVDGISKIVSQSNIRISKISCISASKEAFDVAAILDEDVEASEIPTILKSFATHYPEKYENVVLYFKSLFPLEFSRNICVLTQLVTFYFQEKKLDKAKMVLETIFTEKLQIDDIFALCVVSGLFKNDLATEAVAFFNRIVQQGYSPGRVVYSSMIIECINRGMYFLGFSYFQDFERNQLNSKSEDAPKSVIYEKVIAMLLKLREIETAEFYFQKLRSFKNLRPNMRIYAAIMHAYLGRNRPEKIIELYENMVAENLQIHTGCKLLYALAQGPENFREFYGRFVEESLKLVESGLATSNHIRELQSFYEKCYEYTISYSHEYEMSLVFANDIIKLGLDLDLFLRFRFFIACTTLNEATINELLEEYREKGRNLEKHSYLAYMTFLHKMNRYYDCILLIEKYHSLYAPTANTIYYNLKCYFENKEMFEKTLKIFKQEQWDGQVYAIIIRFYGADKNFDKCIEYWNEFLKKDQIAKSVGINPSKRYIYTRDSCIMEMMWVCIRNNQLEMLKKVWLDSVIAMNLDREKFVKFHERLVPDGDGQKRLIDIR